MNRVVKGIKKGDTVQLISGAQKGTTGAVVSVDTKSQTVRIEGVGVRHRKIKPSQLHPTGGHRDIHVGVPIAKIKKVAAPAKKPAAKKATKESK